MGQWKLEVTGQGVHHNRNEPRDANVMFIDFVRRLRKAGHQIEHAAFVNESRDPGIMAELSRPDVPEPTS